MLILVNEALNEHYINDKIFAFTLLRRNIWRLNLHNFRLFQQQFVFPVVHQNRDVINKTKSTELVFWEQHFELIKT